MNIDNDQVRHLGKLSKVALNEEEVEGLRKDLEKIVSYVDELSKVNVDNVEPMFNVSEDALRLYEDKEKEVLGQNAIKDSSGYFEGLIRVPKII